MFRKNFHRGFTAVVFAAALTVVGAQPVAAEGLGWRQAWDWLMGFWSTTATCASGDCGPEIDPNGSTVNGDCGAEIDPNGRTCPLPSAGGEIDPNG